MCNFDTSDWISWPEIGSIWPDRGRTACCKLFLFTSYIVTQLTGVTMTYRDTIRHYMGWTLTGVDFSLPGNGGPDCVEFIPHKQKIVETVAFSLLALVWLAWSYPRIKLPERLPEPSRIDSTMKRVVLMAMCLIFGIELGFKFASHQFIWILNPCHIISMMQVSGGPFQYPIRRPYSKISWCLEATSSWVQPPILTISSNLAIIAKLGDPKCL